MPAPAEATVIARRTSSNGVSGAIRYALHVRVVKRNFVIALVVGTLLTLANQFDVIARGPVRTDLLGQDLLQFSDSVRGFVSRCIREPMRSLDRLSASRIGMS